MPDQPTTNSDLIIGEMRGQLREMVHSVNNLGSKFDSLAREVMALATLAGELGKLQAKVEILEAQKLRSEGATNVGLAILRSPTVGWIVGGATTLWALVTGRLHL